MTLTLTLTLSQSRPSQTCLLPQTRCWQSACFSPEESSVPWRISDPARPFKGPQDLWASSFRRWHIPNVVVLDNPASCVLAQRTIAHFIVDMRGCQPRAVQRSTMGCTVGHAHRGV